MNRHLWTLRAFYLQYRQQCLLLSAAALLLVLLLVIGFSGDNNGAQPSERQVIVPPEESAELQDPVRVPDHDVRPEGMIVRDAADAAEMVPAPEITGAPPHRIALIIDDLGNNDAAGRRAIALPADLTFAVLPHTPHGRSLAEVAHNAGKEIMLHAPMSNQSGMDPGLGRLTPDMSESEFGETLLAALADIPHVQGVKNHTGSELTTLPEQMGWVMRKLKLRGLYFVDSVTTADSVAADVATEHQVPNVRRQVFLDNSADPDDIHFEFERLLSIAQRDGQAVGIGHPYPQTLDYLEQVIPTLADRGFELVFVSTLLADVAGNGGVGQVDLREP